MTLLAIDVGSSSIKSAILRESEIVGRVARARFETRYEGVRVEVEPKEILAALADAIRRIGPAARKVDAIGLTVMSPSWVAMDKAGKPLTAIVTHQDRRSVEAARALESVGKERHLRLAGNRPFPGGISSTTWAWHLQHSRQTMRKADLVGHLNTFLHRHLTGARVTDPSNASFMGVYNTLTLSGWNEELLEAVGGRKEQLPQVLEADRIGGRITAGAAGRFGLREGTPMMVGLMDGSAGMLLAGAKAGQLVNSSGSTDVLALCTDRPAPHEKVLTRALGVKELWLAVGTIAAAGSAIDWARKTLFADLDAAKFKRLLKELASWPTKKSGVRFEPYLAGDRASIEQRQGAFAGLTLSTTRQEMLGAIIESLAEASAARIPLLAMGGVRMRREVVVTGGVQEGLESVLYRDWPGKWRFREETEATLRGVGRMSEFSSAS